MSKPVYENAKLGDIVLSMENLEEKYPGQFIACDQQPIPKELGDEMRLVPFSKSSIESEIEISNPTNILNSNICYPTSIGSKMFISTFSNNQTSGLLVLDDNKLSNLDMSASVFNSKYYVLTMTVVGDRLWVIHCGTASGYTNADLALFDKDGKYYASYNPSNMYLDYQMKPRFIRLNNKNKLLICATSFGATTLSSLNTGYYRPYIFSGNDPNTVERITYSIENESSTTFQLVESNYRSNIPYSKDGCIPFSSTWQQDSSGNLYCGLFRASGNAKFWLLKLDEDELVMKDVVNIDLYSKIRELSPGANRLTNDDGNNYYSYGIINDYFYIVHVGRISILAGSSTDYRTIIDVIKIDLKTYEITARSSYGDCQSNVEYGKSDTIFVNMENVSSLFNIGTSLYMVCRVAKTYVYSGTSSNTGEYVLIKMDPETLSGTLLKIDEQPFVLHTDPFSSSGFVTMVEDGILCPFSNELRMPGPYGLYAPLYFKERRITPPYLSDYVSSNPTDKIDSFRLYPYRYLYLYIKDGYDPVILTSKERATFVGDIQINTSIPIYFDEVSKNRYFCLIRNEEFPIDKRTAPYIPNGYMRVISED